MVAYVTDVYMPHSSSVRCWKGRPLVAPSGKASLLVCHWGCDLTYLSMCIIVVTKFVNKGIHTDHLNFLFLYLIVITQNPTITNGFDEGSWVLLNHKFIYVMHTSFLSKIFRRKKKKTYHAKSIFQMWAINTHTPHTHTSHDSINHCIYRCLNARLQYLQHVSNGDTEVHNSTCCAFGFVRIKLFDTCVLEKAHKHRYIWQMKVIDEWVERCVRHTQ